MRTLLLGVLVLGTLPAIAAERPNIILVMCDDLGWGDVGFNGNTIIKTPHLDEMAKAGLKFNRFYAAAPVCSPTRGSVMTGRHPYRYGIFFANSGHMKPEEVTLAEVLKANGYATGHFGKWHLGTLTKTGRDANRGGDRNLKNYAPPWDHGFDVTFSTESKVPTWDPLFRPKNNNSKTWWDPVTDADDAIPYGTSYWSHGKSITENTRGDNSRVIMDRVVPYLENCKENEKPFFAVIWFHTPHLPVVAGPKHTAMYAQYTKYEQHYYGCITAMDEQMGRLRKTLRDLKLADNTMVWFCSDNGPEGQTGKAPGSAGHLRGRKRSLYEGGIRVPALLEWPAKIQAGSVTDIPCCTSDYLPTVRDLLQLPGEPGISPIDGVSLAKLITGKAKSRPHPIGFESREQIALIDNRYKLIHVPTGKKQNAGGSKKKRAELQTKNFELYDLQKDPSEKKNIAKAHPYIVLSMSAILERWRKSCQNSLAGGDYE